MKNTHAHGDSYKIKKMARRSKNWPYGGVCKGSPLPKKFVLFGELKMHNFKRF